jgi:translocation and assembly module TamB
MKRRAVALVALLTLCVLAAGLAGGLYWASRSTTVLRWALEQAAHRLPGQLQVDGLSGSLSQPIAIARVRYTHNALTVEAREVTLDWSPWELIAHERVHIQELRIRVLDVLTSEGKPAQQTAMPDNLALPFPLSVDRLLIDRLSVRNGAATVFAATDVRASYAEDQHRHRLNVENLSTQWGRANADMELDAHKPFAINARADFQGEIAPQWPAVAHLKLTGSLTTSVAALSLRLRDTSIDIAARITPFAAAAIDRITAKATGVDLKRFFAAAPQTAFDAIYQARLMPGARLEGHLALDNRMPGTIDQGRAPLVALQGELALARDAMKLSRAAIDMGAAGKATLEAEVARDTTTVKLVSQRVDLRGIHSALRTTHLAGSVTAVLAADRREFAGTLSQDAMRLAFRARQQGDSMLLESVDAQSGAARITASGKIDIDTPNAFSAQGTLTHFDPAAYGDFPKADINGSLDASGALRPDWHVTAAYRLARSTFRGKPLSGAGKLTASTRAVRDVDAELALSGNRLHLQGAFGNARDTLRFQLDAPALQALGPRWAGSAHAEGSVSGTLERPGLQIDASARSLALPGDYRADSVQVRGRLQQDESARFELTGHAQGLIIRGQSLQAIDVHGEGSRREHRLQAHLVGAHLDVTASVEGGWTPSARSWSGRVIALENRGDYPFKMNSATHLSAAPDQIAVGATTIELLGGRVNLGDTRYDRGTLASSGSLTGVSAGKLLEWMQIAAPVQTSVQLGGRWNIAAKEHVNGSLELHRESGEVSIAVDEQQLALQVAQLAARIDIGNDIASGNLEVDAKRLGHLTARAQTRLTQRDGKWGVSSRAPLTLSAKADIVTLKPLVALYNKSIVADGRLALEVNGNGSLAEPNLRGKADAQQITLEQVENGVFLHDGVAHATFDGRGLTLSELSIAAGDGRFNGKGRLLASEGRIDAHIDWSAVHLAAVQRPDLILALSGNGTLDYQREQLALRGQVHVDRGRIELRSGTAPSLSDDVEVVGRKSGPGAKARMLKSAVDLAVDLGPDFKVTGSGLDARVEGKLHLQSPGEAPLSAQGEISITRGTYEAYGRKLEIEKGTLYFTGPLDNPGLNIRAMRKNQQVEAGVEITGTVRAPLVRLISNPEVPDQEKLAWLVLGRKVDAGSRTDTQALQSSAALLLADMGTSPLQKRLAQELGLDEISISAAEAGGTGGVVTLAKRISDRIYVIVESGLGSAGTAIKVNYQLSRRWSLRTESGHSEAVDLFYTLSWD